MKTFLATFFSLALSAPAGAFTLCIENADYLPFIDGTGERTSTGMLPEIASLAARENGTTVGVVAHPWKRCIDMVSKGEADALMAAIWTPERDSWGAYPKRAENPKGAPDGQLRLWRAQYPVFVPLQSSVRFDGKQFSGLKTGLGAPPGYIVWQRLQAQDALSPDVLLPKIGLRLVALNRLDGYVVERNIGRHQLLLQGVSEQVKTLPALYQEDDWFMVFSLPYQAKHPQLTQSIWQSIARIRQQQGDTLLAKFQDMARAKSALAPPQP